MNEPVLQAEHLAAGYPGRTVLMDVSFAVRPGELVGLIGANGAGKSTLLKTVRGLLAPLGGTVALLGTGIQSLSPRAFAQRAAYLSQQTEIPFGYTVRDIAMTGRYPYLGWWQREGGRDRALVDASLAYVGMTALADRPMQELSGGQRQRALFAKVLAHDDTRADEADDGWHERDRARHGSARRHHDSIHRHAVFPLSPAPTDAGAAVIAASFRFLPDMRQRPFENF